MLPNVLRAEIQRAEAIALIKPLFACFLQWAHGLHTIKKAPEIEGNMSPDTHLGNYTSSVLSPCETAISGTSQRSGKIPWSCLTSYLSYFHPNLATGTSTIQQEHPRFLLSEGHACGKDGFGYVLFVFKLYFQLEIYSVRKLCRYSSVSKSVKEITS